MQGKGVRRTQQVVDANLILKVAGLIAATANGAVIIDLGGGGQLTMPMVHMDWVNDVTAIETATGDEHYTVRLEGSNSATFASGIEVLDTLELGHATPQLGNTDVTADAGRYVKSVANERNGRTYRYLRLHTTVVGTIATGINFVSGLTMRTGQ